MKRLKGKQLRFLRNDYLRNAFYQEHNKQGLDELLWDKGVTIFEQVYKKASENVRGASNHAASADEGSKEHQDVVFDEFRELLASLDPEEANRVTRYAIRTYCRVKGESLSHDDLVAETQKAASRVEREVNEFLGVSAKLPPIRFIDTKKGLFLSSLEHSVINETFWPMHAAQVGLAINNPLLIPAGIALNMACGTYGLIRRIKKENLYGAYGARRIYVKSATSTDLNSTLGHEYAHFIQDTVGRIGRGTRIFGEGHAMGVEREVAERISPAEGAAAEQFSLNLVKEASDLLEARLAGNAKHIRPKGEAYILGGTLMWLYERALGKEVYGEMLRDPEGVHREYEKKMGK